MGYVTSKPINPIKSNEESHCGDNAIKIIEQDIDVQNIDTIPKPIQSRSLANSPWPMFRHDLNHTGQSQYNTSTNKGTLLWNFTTGSYVYSSPAIGPDGTIYIGSDDGNLYAINPNGTKKWNFTTGNTVKSSPAIDFNGTIYFRSYDNNLYAIYPNGTKKWSIE